MTPGPLGPVRSIKGPADVQLSCQKLAVIPLWTSQTIIGCAKCLKLYKLFQIQLSDLCGWSSQNFLSPIKFLLTQETHREPPAAKINQINFNPRTWFHSSNHLSPKPPSSLSVQTEIQEALTLLATAGAPLQRNALHIFSNSLQYSFGMIKIETQKKLWSKLLLEWVEPVPGRKDGELSKN